MSQGSPPVAYRGRELLPTPEISHDERRTNSWRTPKKRYADIRLLRDILVDRSHIAKGDQEYSTRRPRRGFKGAIEYWSTPAILFCERPLFEVHPVRSYRGRKTHLKPRSCRGRAIQRNVNARHCSTTSASFSFCQFWTCAVREAPGSWLTFVRVRASGPRRVIWLSVRS